MGLLEKLSYIQQEIKVPKTKENSFGNYKYRTSEDILKELKKHTRRQGVFVKISEKVVCIGTSNYIQSTVTLCDIETDEEISSTAYAKEPAQPKPKMDESQTTGSATSYARKYALSGLLLLDDSVDPDSDRAIDSGEPASKAHIKTIEDIAKKHNVNLVELYKRYKVKEIPTAAQAGLILNIFKKNFGD